MTDIDESEREKLIVEIMQRLERRGVLAGGAGLLTGGALVAGASSDASAGAGSESVGGVGTASNPVDLVAEDIFPPGGSGSGNSTFIEKIETATIVDDDTGTEYDVGDELAGGSGATLSERQERIDTVETGPVASGDAGLVYSTTVPDGSSMDIYQAGMYLVGTGYPPSGITLTFVTLTSGGAINAEQTTIISGDGTDKTDLTGNPLASYSNSSGGSQTVGIVVDNGQLGAAGTGSQEEAVVSLVGGVV